MNATSCMTCRFCGSVPLPDKTLQFVCRLNPPAVHAQAFHAGNTANGPQIIWASNRFLPVVSDVDWCGRFESEKAPADRLTPSALLASS